jgi:hypothetical protein
MNHRTSIADIPELLLPLTSILKTDCSPEAVCIALARSFEVQSTEVALLRLNDGLLRFLYPEHLRSTGGIPITSSAIAAHTALSKTAEIFNNFAEVKHASIFEFIRPTDADVNWQAPLRIQKLMSVPIIESTKSKAIGVIQISHKGLEARFVPDFTREEMHNLELAADLLSTAPFLVS